MPYCASCLSLMRPPMARAMAQMTSAAMTAGPPIARLAYGVTSTCGPMRRAHARRAPCGLPTHV